MPDSTPARLEPADSLVTRVLTGCRMMGALGLVIASAVWLVELRGGPDARGLLVFLWVGGLLAGCLAGGALAMAWGMASRLASRRGWRVPRFLTFCGLAAPLGSGLVWCLLWLLLHVEGGSGLARGGALLAAAALLAASAVLTWRMAAGLDALLEGLAPTWSSALSRLPVFLAVGSLLATGWVMADRSGTRGRHGGHESARVESRPPRPNIILVSLDTVRPDHLSANGYHRPTSPYLDQLIREGALFEQTISSSSWTIPAHAALFTGQSPSRIGTELLEPADSGGLYLPESARTLAEVLREQGYATAAFIGAPPMGSSFGFDQGFSHFDERLPPSLAASLEEFFPARAVRDLMDIRRGAFLQAFAPLFLSTCNFIEGQDHRLAPPGYVRHRTHARRFWNTAEEINSKVERYLDDAPDAPQFLFLHYFDAHDPYDAPAPAFGRFGNDDGGLGYIMDNGLLFEVMNKGRALTGREKELLVGMYDEEIAGLDASFQALMERLEARGFLKDAIVILYSDHGESFGEHGDLFHGHSLHEELIRILFSVRAPGRVPPAVRVAPPVRSVDILPTILDLAGLDPRLAGRIEGRSLSPLLKGESPAGESMPDAFSEVYAEGMGHPHFGPFQLDHLAIRSGDWKLVSSSDGVRHLYDLATDPAESIDLLEARPDVAARLAGKLIAWRREGYAKSADAAKGDAGRIESLRSLGYVSQSP